MVFLVDPDELQRAMGEIAAQQSTGSDSASPPAAPPEIAKGQQSTSSQAGTLVAMQPPSAAPNNYSKFNPYAGINYNFIAGHEGPGEYPYRVKGADKSGVTIATGVDLSEHTAQELRDWGVSEDTIAKLAPFLKSPDGKTSGPKGDAAKTALNKFNRENPTSADGLPGYEIPMSDSQAMDTGVLKSITGYVQHYYDATNPRTPFAQLPDAVRTTIMDAAYQNGPNLAVSAPRFWRAITAGDWMGAADEMHNWTDAQRADPNAPRNRRQLDDEGLLRTGIYPYTFRQ